MSNQHEENIVCVAHALTPAEAHIWQNALEEEGIRCKVVGDFLEAGIGNISGLRAELWVHEEDAERARQILDQHPGSEALPGGEEE